VKEISKKSVHLLGLSHVGVSRCTVQRMWRLYKGFKEITYIV